MLLNEAARGNVLVNLGFKVLLQVPPMNSSSYWIQDIFWRAWFLLALIEDRNESQIRRVPMINFIWLTLDLIGCTFSSSSWAWISDTNWVAVTRKSLFNISSKNCIKCDTSINHWFSSLTSFWDCINLHKIFKFVSPTKSTIEPSSNWIQ